MSEIERAIELLEGVYDFETNGIIDIKERDYYDALSLSVTALREKAEREKGCEYCEDGVYYDVLGTPCRYKFCPMCGRPLHEPRAEQEESK